MRNSSAATILVLALSGPAFADGLTAADVLGWPGDSQSFFLSTAIGMAGVIATQNDPAKARCLDEWYFADRVGANQEILDAMGRFPTYHPHGVLMAVIEKRCGSFDFRA